MAELKPNEQRWIVIQLAVFRSAKDVAEDFQKEFNRPISRQQVWEYDCSKAVNKGRRSAELVELFESTREEFKEQTEDVLIATAAGRMQEYQRLFDDARRDDMPRLQLSILEQAAKDLGGAFTNKRDLTSDGQPFKALVGVDLDAV